MARIIETANLVRDAGGELVGRTRLQKLAYFLEVAGLGDGFAFEYRRFGPYSEELSMAARDAALLNLMNEDEMPTSWGGLVSIFSTTRVAEADVPAARKELARLAARADSTELELAATALFLRLKGEASPWLETARRKPEKAEDGRLERAKSLYRKIQRISTPNSLPDMA